MLDPRLDAAIRLLTEAEAEGCGRIGLGAELARGLGISERTARRLLAAARLAGGNPVQT